MYGIQHSQHPPFSLTYLHKNLEETQPGADSAVTVELGAVPRGQAVPQTCQGRPGDYLVIGDGGFSEFRQDLVGVDELGPVGLEVPPQEAWLASLQPLH